MTRLPRGVRPKILVFQSIMGNPAAQVIRLLDKFDVILYYVMVSSFLNYDRETVIFQLVMKRELATF